MMTLSTLAWRMLATTTPTPAAWNAALAYERGWQASREPRAERADPRVTELEIALRQLADAVDDTNDTARTLAVAHARHVLGQEAP